MNQPINSLPKGREKLSVQGAIGFAPLYWFLIQSLNVAIAIA